MDQGQETKEALSEPVPQFAVIDFDRTLVNTNAIMSRLYGLAEGFDINAQKILDAQEETEGRNEPFDPLPLIREELGNDQSMINEFKERFINGVDPPLMYDDVE